METEIRIQVQEGMEIDKEHSTFECIKFKTKKLMYDDIQKKIMPYTRTVFTTPMHQSKCITFRKLLEVADYLNGDWKPDWNNNLQDKYSIVYNNNKEVFEITTSYKISLSAIYFSSEENAKKAIEIIGKEELKQFFL